MKRGNKQGRGKKSLSFSLPSQGTLASCLRQEEIRDKRFQLQPLDLVHWWASWSPSTPKWLGCQLYEEEVPPELTFDAGKGPLPGPESRLLSNPQK